MALCKKHTLFTKAILEELCNSNLLKSKNVFETTNTRLRQIKFFYKNISMLLDQLKKEEIDFSKKF